MSSSLNRVMLMGNLTRDPEVRFTPKDMALSTAQTEARAKAIELLGEHFIAYVLITESEIESQEPGGQTIWHGAYDGGSSAALGLMEKYRKRILDGSKNESIQGD